MRILNIGSTNIDLVFSVDHIVAPGETIASSSLTRSTGGKGANQSVALAKAGGLDVYHGGLVGPDGSWIKEKLADYGVNTSLMEERNIPTGQALIQVDKKGENSIVLFSGANKAFTKEHVDALLNHFEPGDWLVLQNEINMLDYCILAAKKKGLLTCFNPAPFEDQIKELALDQIDLLVLNEIEAQGLGGFEDPMDSLKILTQQYKDTAMVLTLGDKGAIYGKGESQRFFIGAWDVPVIDTTAAGDTFIGYFLATFAKSTSVEKALYQGSRAAAVTVMREGAMDSIPSPKELDILESYTLRPFLK